MPPHSIMPKPTNRLQLMKRLGAVQANTVWAWCAVNTAQQRVYFSVWTDHVQQHDGQTTYLLQEPHWGLDEQGRMSPARKDQEEKLALVFDEGFRAYAYFIEAKDRNAPKREIAATRTTFVMQMRLSRTDAGCVVGTPVSREEIS